MTLQVRHLVACAVALLLIVGASWCYERSHGVTPAQLQVAHAHTEAAVAIAAEAETVFVKGEERAAKAETVYVNSRAAALADIHDSAKVVRAIADADATIAAKDTALALADTALVTAKAVTDSVRKELALALRPHYPPRLSGSASGLYDPLAQVPAASLGVNLRVIGRVSLTARADQRFAPGEKPRGYVGVAIGF